VTGGERRRQSRPAPAQPAKAAALSAASRGGGEGRRRRTGGGSAVEPYNEALPFIEFVASHPVGSTVDGEVERFTSHGAYVLADGARCYLPLKHLADPPPRSAREVLSSGTTYTFVVHAFDTPRRGVDLTMPGVVPGSVASPTDRGSAGDPVQPTEEERVAPAKRKTAAKKAPAKRKAAAKKAPARKKAAAKKGAAASKKATAKRTAAAKKGAAASKKATAKRKAAAKKGAAKRKTAAKKAPAKRKTAAKKAPAKRKTAAKRAPARKAAKRR
jgi:hypothetical protein